MADLNALESELRAQHDALTSTFLKAQTEAEAAWTTQEEHARALVEFRAKYGRVLRAFDEARVVVTDTPAPAPTK